MFVRPAPNTWISPELCFFGTCNPHPDIAVVCWRGLLNRPIQNVADLDRSVLADTEQLQRSDSSKRTYFMKDLRPAVEKKALDHIHRGRSQFLEDAESESLSDRGVDTIEDRVCSCAFNPLGTAVGEYPTARLRELSARMPFSALQTS